MIRFPKTRRLVGIRFERHPYGKAGWFLTVDLGPGAGYRWFDLGNYSQSIHDPWYRHLSVSGRTMRLGWRVKAYRNRMPTYRRFGAHFFTKRCNIQLYPGWW